MKKWLNMYERVDAYLQARRNLGFQLRIEGGELQRFARFSAEMSHDGPISLDLALAWANSSRLLARLGRARRLEIVRGLAKYCLVFEPETEIPPRGLLGPAHRRVTPYIFTEEEISKLVGASKALVPKGGLRPETVGCLLGLLAATGLRVSEALHLTLSDVDLDRGLLHVRETKFHKSRYVPLHPTTVKALKNYRQLRGNYIYIPQVDAFFLFDNGKPVNYRQVLYAFQCLREKLGLPRHHGKLPRIHDLRHTFACRRLLAWYRDGENLARFVPFLSTYLGHCKVTDTYWYLSAIPELMSIVAGRFEAFTLRKGG